MRENFVDTISINARPYIFRYELDAEQSAYTVTVLNHRHIEPFVMQRVESDVWKISNQADDTLYVAEPLLCRAIVTNNGSMQAI